MSIHSYSPAFQPQRSFVLRMLMKRALAVVGFGVALIVAVMLHLV